MLRIPFKSPPGRGRTLGAVRGAGRATLSPRSMLKSNNIACIDGSRVVAQLMSKRSPVE